VGQWTVHQWIKKAVLLSFRLNDNAVMRAGDLTFYDKVPTKFAHLSATSRCAPPACAWCPRPWRAAAASSPRA
jgi:2,3,4,5-tetrahydropyridine-2-carboxylate N-succinyltransferase